MAKSNFVVTIKEPADASGPDGVGLMLQFEFHDKVPGLQANHVCVWLEPGAGMEKAEEIARLINQHGKKVSTF